MISSSELKFARTKESTPRDSKASFYMVSAPVACALLTPRNKMQRVAAMQNLMAMTTVMVILMYSAM